MRKRRLWIVVLAVLLSAVLVAGCAAKDYAMDKAETKMSESAAEPAYDMEESDGGQGAVLANEKLRSESDNDTDSAQSLQEKIIYYVNMSLICEDVSEAIDKITAETVELGGYVAYSNMYKSDGRSYASIQVRVPAPKLSAMKSFAKEVGTVESSNMSTENITESYYDIKSRLEHAKSQEVQLLEIMDRAKTIEDILKVRSELDGVQERIESFEGRMRLWDSLVDYSTVTFDLRPTPTLDTEEDGPRLISLGETGRAMVRVFKNTAVHVANFFSLLLRVLTALVIPALIITPIVLLTIYLVRRGKRKRAAKQNTSKQ